MTRWTHAWVHIWQPCCAWLCRATLLPGDTRAAARTALLLPRSIHRLGPSRMWWRPPTHRRVRAPLCSLCCGTGAACWAHALQRRRDSCLLAQVLARRWPRRSVVRQTAALALHAHGDPWRPRRSVLFVVVARLMRCHSACTPARDTPFQVIMNGVDNMTMQQRHCMVVAPYDHQNQCDAACH